MISGNETYCRNCGSKDIDMRPHFPECRRCGALDIRSCSGLPLSLETPVEPEAREKKYDTGKPMVGQMKRDFAKALLAVADVTRYGVEKYNQPGSWKNVSDCFNRYEDALGRHDNQGTYEERDKESGRYHLVHRAWNALATLQEFLEGQERISGEDYMDLLQKGGTFYEND